MRDASIDEALVHAFVATANENEAIAGGQCLGASLVIAPAHRGQQRHRSGTKPLSGARLLGGVDGGFQRPRHHDHAGTAAVGAVVDGAMDVMREIARIPGMQLPPALGMGPAGDPEVAHHPEHFGK